MTLGLVFITYFNMTLAKIWPEDIGFSVRFEAFAFVRGETASVRLLNLHVLVYLIIASQRNVAFAANANLVAALIPLILRPFKTIVQV